jgi:hypothetical protein
MRRLSAAAALAVLCLTAPAFAAETKGEVAATIGAKATSKWTETTDKAAATPEQVATLKKGKPQTVVGEIVEVSCFLQFGKRGEKHIPCGSKCIENGQPIGIVDDKGVLYTLFAEAHDPRRDGKADLKATFLPLLAKRVSVTGMVQESKGSHGLFVDDDALQAPATPAPAPK